MWWSVRREVHGAGRRHRASGGWIGRRADVLELGQRRGLGEIDLVEALGRQLEERDLLVVVDLSSLDAALWSTDISFIIIHRSRVSIAYHSITQSIDCIL